MKKQPARILLALWVAATSNLWAAEQPSKLPKGQELILEAANETGCSDYLYSVPVGRYPATQMEWLRKVHRFRFGDTFEYTVQFQVHAPTPLSPSELTALLNDSAFAAWAGPQLIGAIRTLAEARTALRASASKLPGGAAAETFFDHPAVARYETADRALGTQLQTKFNVTETDVAINCD